MIDRVTVAAWLENYIRAWKTYDPAAIGALFGEDAHYFYSPFDEPVIGRAAIVASWLEGRDPPGTYDAEYKPMVIEDQVAVASGRSRYYTPGTRTIEREFANIFVIRFNDQGECVEFREWYMKRP